jgi:hypothetical protein
VKIITLAVLAVCIASPATAFEIEYPMRFDQPEARKPQVKAWVQRHPSPAPKIITKTVTVYVPDKPKLDARCKPFVAAIGDSAKSEVAAKLEAQAAWKAAVQFEAGNRYIDLNVAETIEYLCGPSSVPAFGGKIEDVASRFLPIVSYRCRISAQPCSVPVQRDVGK